MLEARLSTTTTSASRTADRRRPRAVDDGEREAAGGDRDEPRRHAVLAGAVDEPAVVERPAGDPVGAALGDERNAQLGGLRRIDGRRRSATTGSSPPWSIRNGGYASVISMT